MVDRFEWRVCKAERTSRGPAQTPTKMIADQEEVAQIYEQHCTKVYIWIFRDHDHFCHIQCALKMLLNIGSAMHSRHSQEIGLAELHTLLSHNVVGGGDVEVEVRDAPVGKVDSAGELELFAGHLYRDLSILLALESVLVGVAKKLEGTLDALLELGSVGLVVFVDDPLGASDAVQHTLGDVASELDLEGQRKHIRVQPGAGQLLRRDVVLFGP